MSSAETIKLPDSAGSLTLCIDLDGTLLKTDTLVETALLLVKQKPLSLFLLPLWLLRGKAHLKQQIAQRVRLDVKSLPYHSDLLTYLTEEHRHGRNIVLATGADISVAQQIADHLGLFSKVLATDGVTNLTGERKLRLLKKHIGDADFIYAGNSSVDVPIWLASNNAILVNAPKRLVQRMNGATRLVHVFQDPKRSLGTIVKAIRVHQWAKNLLVFVPLIAGHQFTRPSVVLDAFIAFIAFSLCSSGVYITNDLLDLEADRRHPTKKNRAFAAGHLPLKAGLIALPFFCLAAFVLGSLVSFRFTAVLAFYFISTLAYSFYLKRLLLVDVFVLASLYTLRILAGAAATQISISYWLLLFSLFLFLSLAFLKRFSELQRQHREGHPLNKTRGYVLADIEQLASMGSASGYITALIMALYINSEDVKVLYKQPEVLWLVCPLILYWISRAWLIARRGEMADDPVIFAIKDPPIMKVRGSLIANMADDPVIFAIKDPLTFIIGGAAAVIFVFAIG